MALCQSDRNPLEWVMMVEYNELSEPPLQLGTMDVNTGRLGQWTMEYSLPVKGVNGFQRLFVIRAVCGSNESVVIG